MAGQQNQPNFELLGQPFRTPDQGSLTLVQPGNNFFGSYQPTDVQQKAQPSGSASPTLPSGEKPVYAMTPEELAARQAARGQVEQVPGLLGQVGQTLSNMFVKPMVNLAEFSAEQKYGTGISAEGAPTGQPIKPNTLLGDLATLPATALNVAGLVTDPIAATGSAAKGVAEYVTGLEFDGQPTMGAVTTQPTTTPALESVVTTTPDTGSEVAANTVMAAPEPSSEQIESAQPRLTTVGGASLSEFLGGGAMPEQGFARAEREMAGRGITLTPEQFNELSAQREARIGGGGGTATERDTRRAEARVTSSQNIPTDVREAMNTPAGRLTRDQIKRLTDWQGSAQGQAYMAEQEAAEAEANKPFEPREVEIGGNTYIQLGPNNYQPVRKETTTEPKKSEIESLREEGVKAGLPENLIRQSIASRLGLDLFDEEVMNWMAGNTDTMPSVEGESETSAPISKTIPTITSQEQYDALESGQTYIDSQGVRAVKK